MADVTLSAAVRSSLLSLQNTTSLIDRTQGRLSTGLKVAGPIDDPVAYFQAKALDDRVYDFTEKKNGIDQGISTLSAALDGVNSIEALVRQLKGIGNSMKSASATQFTNLITQYNDLRTQINNLATDASYQGTNLINGTGETLSVEFSDLTAATLSINSVDLTVATTGLDVGQVVAYTAGAVYVSHGASSTIDSIAGTTWAGLTHTGSVTFTWEGGTQSYTAGASFSVTYGGQTLSVVSNESVTLNSGDTFTVNVDSAAGTTGYSVVANDYLDAGIAHSAAVSAVALSGTQTLTWNGASVTTDTSTTYTLTHGGGSITLNFNSATVLTSGATFVVGVASSLDSSETAVVGAFVTAALASSDAAQASTASVGLQIATAVDASTVTNRYVSSGDTTAITRAIAELDSALTTLRSQASVLGSNVALLQTRLDFTERYVNTLGEGSSKLTLADLNTEGANLLALQTRQQLGIQALAFAGQAEQSILRLFG